MKKLFVLLVVVLFFFSCKAKVDEIDYLIKDFDEIVKEAKGSDLSFYMWGGSATINKWVDTYLAKKLKADYDIQLKRVSMDASVFVNKLLAEKKAGKTSGPIDIVWINGENFKNAMEANLLFGPYTAKLPNFINYVNPETVRFDFGYFVNNHEAPYGRAQFVFEYDSEKLKDIPDSFKNLLVWVKKNPGRFSYPQPPDFTGSAFIRQVFYAVTGGHEQYMKGWDAALFEEKSKLLWDYLNKLEPYLWTDGKSYPKDSAALGILFARGEVDFHMSYHQAHAQNNILSGKYKKSVRTFVMKEGSIYNTHFTAIPKSAKNKAAALVFSNLLISPDVQYHKNDPANWGDFTVLDLKKLSSKDKEKFNSLPLGSATLPIDVLNKHAVPEIPSEYLEALEKGWEENVLKK